MLDVTALILLDHETLRRQFAMLDDAGDDPAALGAIWRGLSRLLEVHATCEETIFYPALLKKGENAEDETEDAIDDHNSIRDAVREAEKHEVGSEPWWKAVGEAREENSEHLGEEEREALSDFRRNATDAMRAKLAVAWLDWRYEHDSGAGVSTKDKDVKTYIAENS